jgi:site-specific DNA-methyltransferase (adenine-specific)
MKASAIHTNPGNPRIIKDERFKKLVKSISEFPKMMELRPIVIDSEDMILGGNMRFKALQELKYKDIPDQWIKRADELTEAEKRRFIIEDNIPFGEWDWDTLANEWDQAELLEWGLEIPDFVGQKLEAQEDDYEIPDEIKTDIVLGDLFEIGQHRLLCGDTTISDDIEKLMGNQKADLVLTDPPYNVDYTGKTKDAMKIKNDKKDDNTFFLFLYNSFISMMLNTKRGGVFYVWHADSEGFNFRRAMKEAGITVKQCLIWVKNSMVMGRQDYQWKHEPCLYGWIEGASHHWFGDRKQTTILNFDRPQRNAEHPTMKPVALFAYQILNNTKEGDLVLDGFGGSGTTMVACHQLKRISYLNEFDPKYCQVILDRMRKLDPNIEIRKNGVIWQDQKQS